MALIIGDSHTRVISLGSETLEQDNDTQPHKIAMIGIGRTFLRSFFKVTQKGIMFSGPKQSAIFQDLTGSETITGDQQSLFLSLGFHGVFFYNSKIWENFTLLYEDQDRHFISAQCFDMMVLRFNYHILKFITALRRTGIRPVIIAAPFLPEKFINTPKIKCMSPEELQNLQAAYRSSFSKALKARGVDVIQPPNAACKNGLLSKKYVRSDETAEYHGNKAYGALVLNQINEYEERRNVKRRKSA